jgi:hypothetical protein
MTEISATDPVVSSASVELLAEALAKAQGEFPAIKKGRTANIDSDKRAYSYTYADLADVLEAVRKPLSTNGLAVIQPLIWKDDHPWLITRLLHSSGQWIESLYPLGTFARPQEMGSAITYARRYTLTSLLGIAAEDDDDGNAAQESRDTERRASAPREAPPPCPTCESTKHVMRSKFGSLPWYCRECKKPFVDSASAFEADGPPPD